MKKVLKVIYSPKYLNYDFGPDHPFRPERARLFLELLDKEKFPFEKIESPKATDKDILLVHTKEYLHLLKQMVTHGGGYLSSDTPITSQNLEAAYYYVNGTITACRLALEKNLVVNTHGGMHHAQSFTSSGFCIFNDPAIAIRKLQKEKLIKTAAVLDLDVHAGNGTQEIFYADPTVLTISIHQDPLTLYPGTGFSEQTGNGKGEGFNINYPLPPRTGESEYLPVLDKAIGKIQGFNPDLTVVIFGVDTYYKDPLAEFQLKKESYFKIARRLEVLRNKAILFAGGYSKNVPELWLQIIRGLLG